MEKKIFEIIDRNLMLDMPYLKRAKKNTAKEIADHFREFIEWIIFSNDNPYWYEEHKGRNMYWHEETDKYFTLEEVYQYWIDNMLNLKQK